MYDMNFDEAPEPYKAYKNRLFTKHVDKIKNQVTQIKSTSLKAEDKVKLIKLIATHLNP